MSNVWQGLEQVQKRLESIDRRITRERQAQIIAAARKTLVPAIKAAAPAEKDSYSGRTMKGVVTARKGKGSAVLVGPKGGKSGVWFRHITVGGAKAHLIAPKKKRVLASALRSFGPVSGPVMHPGRRGNPFVARGVDASRVKFVDEVRERLLGPKEVAP